jgi:hypothetical protein
MHCGDLRKFEKLKQFGIGNSKEYGEGVIWNLRDNKYTHLKNTLWIYSVKMVGTIKNLLHD